MLDSQLTLLGLILLLGLDLLTVALQAAYQNASLARLLALQDQEQEPGQAARALTLVTSQPRLGASLQFSLALLHLLLAGLTVFYLFETQNNAPAALLLVGLLVLAALLVGLLEFVVVWWVSRDPERWAMGLAPLARGMIALLTPLLALPMAIFRYPEAGEGKPGVVTEDDLKTLVEASQREGVLEQDEREMIFSIFRFGDTLAREVMVPRIDVLGLDADTSVPDAVDAMLESGFSRAPVFVDTIDNIIGLLYVKDLLRAWRDGNLEVPIRDLLRPAYFIPETKKVADLLEEMQAQRVHMAIVVDEYGGMAGLVTLEDIVEEIIGEVRDEYDQGEELPYLKVDEEEYIFNGRIDLDDFNLFMHSDLPNDEADTLGGFIYSRIGRVPKGGESLQADDILLTVEQVSGRRIRKVRAQRLAPDSENNEVPSNAAG